MINYVSYDNDLAKLQVIIIFIKVTIQYINKQYKRNLLIRNIYFVTFALNKLLVFVLKQFNPNTLCQSETKDTHCITL